jgi:hypothetical protein
MINKKAYSNPEIYAIAIENSDVILLSNDPSVGDVSWASDFGGGANETL